MISGESPVVQWLSIARGVRLIHVREVPAALLYGDRHNEGRIDAEILAHAFEDANVLGFKNLRTTNGWLDQSQAKFWIRLYVPPDAVSRMVARTS